MCKALFEVPRPEEKQTKKKVPTVLVNFPYCSENDLETQLQIYSDPWTLLVLRELQNADGGVRDTADDVAGCDWRLQTALQRLQAVSSASSGLRGKTDWRAV